jgi:hypothetical protein
MKQRNLYSPFSLCVMVWRTDILFFLIHNVTEVGVTMESSVLMCSLVFYAVLDLWHWISDITRIMCGKQSCEHRHWRYKVHWQLHHNSAVHLLFMLAHNQRCQSLVFHCHFISNQKRLSYIYCIFSPAEKGNCSPKGSATGLSNRKVDEYHFLRLTFTFCQQIIWCWKTFRFLVCHSFDTKLIFRLHWKEAILCLPVTWRSFIPTQKRLSSLVFVQMSAKYVSFCKFLV